MFESEEGDAFALYAKTGASANAYTSFDKSRLFSCSGQFQGVPLHFDAPGHPSLTSPPNGRKGAGDHQPGVKMYDDSPGSGG